MECMKSLHNHIKGLRTQLQLRVSQFPVDYFDQMATDTAAATATIATLANNHEMSSDSGYSENDEQDYKLDMGDDAYSLFDTLHLSYARWAKLEKDFYSKKTKTFDISKIPDIYDCVKVCMYVHSIVLYSCIVCLLLYHVYTKKAEI